MQAHVHTMDLAKASHELIAAAGRAVVMIPVFQLPGFSGTVVAGPGYGKRGTTAGNVREERQARKALEHVGVQAMTPCAVRRVQHMLEDRVQCFTFSLCAARLLYATISGYFSSAIFLSIRVCSAEPVRHAE